MNAVSAHTPFPTTWSALAAELAERYPAMISDGPLARRVVLVTRGEQPVRVGIRLRAATAYGREAIVITADIGQANSIDPLFGLVSNALLVHGALAVEGAALVFRCVTFASDETVDSLESRMQTLAAEAIELKRHRGGVAANDGVDLAAFAHVCD